MAGIVRALSIVCVAALCWGCAEKNPELVEGVEGLIRLVDRDRIDSFDTTCPELLDGTGPAWTSETPFCVLDANADWTPFLASVEFRKKEITPDLQPPVIRIAEQKDQLLLGSDAGVACLLPVKPVEKIFIESQGGFDPEGGCDVRVFQLKPCPGLWNRFKPGELRSLVSKFGIGGPLALTPSEDGSSASGELVVDNAGANLLVLVHAKEDAPGRLEEVRMTRLTARYDFLRKRKQEIVAHPAIASTPFVEGIIRSSFCLPPDTSIDLKEIVLHKPARFRCGLGVLDETFAPVRFSVTAREKGGADETVVERILEPPLKGWREIEADLSRFVGKAVHLSIACKWKDGAAGEHAPLVFCGSPIIYFELPERADSDYNLLVISLDTLRWDHLGCYGYSRPVSPRIDTLATEGVFFKRVYAQAPWTLASHASLFTGHFPIVHGTRSRDDHLAEGVVLLGEVLADAGLATASFNSGGFLSHEFGFHRGFDLYCEVDPIGDRYFEREGLSLSRWNYLADGSAGSLSRALSWIDEMRDQRFYLFLHTFMVHEYLPPPDLAEEFNKGCKSTLEPGVRSRFKIALSHVDKHGLSDVDRAFFINMYDATVRAADDLVDEVLQHFQDLGILDKTIVVVTSDHGEEFLDHGSVKHSQTLYEEMIRVPLIMRVPGMPRGLTVPYTINQVDVMPTVLELMGIDCPMGIQGRSLVPLLSGKEEKDRLIYSETYLPGISERYCIIENNMKCIKGATGSAVKYPAPAPWEFFEILEDPEEKTNLTGALEPLEGQLQNRLDRLQQDLLRVRKSMGIEDQADRSVSPELMELLKQQGYL